MCRHPGSSKTGIECTECIKDCRSIFKAEIIAWLNANRSTAKYILYFFDTLSFLDNNSISFFTTSFRFSSILNGIMNEIHGYVSYLLNANLGPLLDVTQYSNIFQYNCSLHRVIPIGEISAIPWLSLFRKRNDTSIEFVTTVKEYRIILARAFGRTEVETIRLCSKYNVFLDYEYRYRSYTRSPSCSVDVVVPYSETALMHTAEVIFIASEMSKAGLKKCRVHLNHTSLVKAILLHCEIPEKYHIVVFSVLQVSEDCLRVKISSKELLNKLRNVLPLSATCLERFVNYISMEATVDRAMIKLKDVTSERNEAGLLAKEALDEVAQLDSLLQDTVDIIPTLGFVNDIRCYAGIIFRVISDNQQVTGGRYDALLASCKSDVDSTDKTNHVRQVAAGFTISSSGKCCLKSNSVQPSFTNRTTKKIVPDGVIVAPVNESFTMEQQFKVAVMLWKEGIPAILYDENSHGPIANLKTYCESHGVRFVVFVKSQDSCEIFDSKNFSKSNTVHPNTIAIYLKTRSVPVTLEQLSGISKFKLPGRTRLKDWITPNPVSISKLPAHVLESEYSAITLEQLNYRQLRKIDSVYVSSPTELLLQAKLGNKQQEQSKEKTSFSEN